MLRDVIITGEVMLGLQQLLHAVVGATAESHIELIADAESGKYQQQYVGN